jgi:hypothetical protein
MKPVLQFPFCSLINSTCVEDPETTCSYLFMTDTGSGAISEIHGPTEISLVQFPIGARVHSMTL